MRILRHATLAAALVTVIAYAAPSSASALSAGGTLCGLTGLVNGTAGKVCSVARHAGQVVSAGKKLLGGHVGGAVKALLGSTAGKAVAGTAGAVAIIALAVGGARYLLRETATVIGSSTRPNLQSTWFSASYWRMAAVSALLTLPFLFAAAIQALIRSDLAMLVRATFGYLPLGLIAVGIAAPLTMLLLAASDEMSSIVASASGHADASFLTKVSALTGLAALGSGTEFVAFFVALLTVAATMVLWIELLIRDAAIYVIVLMLPLFFAALVWPARRIWAIRAVETLVALILSKFAIVAVLSLGGAALGHTVLPGPASILSGATLVLLAAFSPWALLRLLPLHELASAAAGGLRGHGMAPVIDGGRRAEGVADQAQRAIAQLSAPSAEEPDRLSDASRVDGATNGRAQPEDAVSAGPGVAADGAAGGGVAGDGVAGDGVAGQAAEGVAQASAAGPAAAAGTGNAPNSKSGEPPEDGAQPTPHATELWEQERGQGMEPEWKAQDSEWPVISLADHGVLESPPSLLPPGGEPRPERASASPDQTPTPDLEREPEPEEGAAEDHDPLPPVQDDGQGWL